MDHGSEIKRRREALGLTQGELAGRLGVTPRTVGNWERSAVTPSVSTVERIELVLGTAERARKLRIADRASGVTEQDLIEAERERMRAFEGIFDRWSTLFSESLLLELDYARRRGIQVREAHDELWEALTVAQAAAKGERPWEPPWADDEMLEAGGQWMAERAIAKEAVRRTPGLTLADTNALLAGGPALSQQPPLDVAARSGVPDTRVADAQDQDAEAPDDGL